MSSVDHFPALDVDLIYEAGGEGDGGRVENPDASPPTPSSHPLRVLTKNLFLRAAAKCRQDVVARSLIDATKQHAVSNKTNESFEPAHDDEDGCSEVMLKENKNFKQLKAKKREQNNTHRSKECVFNRKE
ncbi:transcriptional regulator [Anopheles sinensis]|uniref:Transcriptional regulator n=1 Tax=Anopheles sinensis TaxID=74873 RepID=A0A084WKH8_ANOSI|nr:transcriptional regulator [Anopheles sinensis]